MPLGWRVVNITGVGVLLFSLAVLVLDPAQWRLALTEICVGFVLLRIVEGTVGFTVLRIVPRDFGRMTKAPALRRCRKPCSRRFPADGAD